MDAPFDQLPDEIIRNVVSFLTPLNLPALELTSNRLRRLANEPLLWRNHCASHYKFWDERHQIREKFRRRVRDTDWKELYISRCRTSRKTGELLNSIISSYHGRIAKIDQLVESGYDVKDDLLEHTRADEGQHDVLARRYWSNSILAHLHRSLALHIWRKLQEGGDVSLEKSLAAYDMFVLENRAGDWDSVSEHLDRLALEFRTSQHNFNELTLRQRALSLVAYLLDHDLTGVEAGEDYMVVNNNFIGFALRDQDHRSTPLTSCAIYVSLAARLGINASPISYPFHVYVIVTPSPSQTLDGAPAPCTSDFCSSTSTSSMYLDPFRSREEVSLEDLQRQLNMMGIEPAKRPALLAPANVKVMTLRAAYNIYNSRMEHSQRRVERPAEAIDQQDAAYAAVWALQIHNAFNRPDLPPMIQTLDMLRVWHFEDASFIREHLLPKFQENSGLQHCNDVLDMVLTLDKKSVKRKSRLHSRLQAHDGAKDGKRSDPAFKIGQIFRHRRYNYHAVIFGWDAKCTMDETWIAQMNIDDLSGGRMQSFYNALPDEERATPRYVAEENIEIVHEWNPGRAVSEVLGRYFLRWDAGERRYISNMTGLYPDD